MQSSAFAMRQVMGVNCAPAWEVVGRSVEHPRLCMRQGPMLFIAEVSRQGDYYQIESIRWLRPKALGPVGGLGRPAENSAK